MNHSFYILILLLFSTVLKAQSDIPIEAWKSHLSYREGSRVTQSKDKIIYAAGLGMILIDKSDLSVSFLSKEDGLTDIRIMGLYYDRFKRPTYRGLLRLRHRYRPQRNYNQYSFH
jgi:hypothetical protein